MINWKILATKKLQWMRKKSRFFWRFQNWFEAEFIISKLVWNWIWDLKTGSKLDFKFQNWFKLDLKSKNWFETGFEISKMVLNWIWDFKTGYKLDSEAFNFVIGILLYFRNAWLLILKNWFWFLQLKRIFIKVKILI